MNAYPLAHLIWILPLAALTVWVGSPRFLGTIALSRVRRLLRSGLDPRHYTVLDDLTLPAGGGTFHVDVVVVSRRGIFVIDAVHRPGQLSGTRVQARWTEKRWGQRRRFDNPVHDNALKIQALERLLDLPPTRFHGLVAVSGKDRLDSGLPENVVTVARLLARIRAETRAPLEAHEADRVVRGLRDLATVPTWRERGTGWKVLRAGLLVLLLGGTYLVYRPQIHSVAATVQKQADWRMAPENFHPDGTPKTERERWEDSLICSYSVDTGRCACYEPLGDRAVIDPDRCRELAERGSILDR